MKSGLSAETLDKETLDKESLDKETIISKEMSWQEPHSYGMPGTLSPEEL